MDKYSVYPRAYTDKEGGEWKEWGFGYVSYLDLYDAQNGGPTTTINNKKVHSLRFESPAVPFGLAGRWDCINGWSRTIKEARKKWPEGKHGLPPDPYYLKFGKCPRCECEKLTMLGSIKRCMSCRILFSKVGD